MRASYIRFKEIGNTGKYYVLPKTEITKISRHYSWNGYPSNILGEVIGDLEGMSTPETLLVEFYKYLDEHEVMSIEVSIDLTEYFIDQGFEIIDERLKLNVND